MVKKQTQDVYKERVKENIIKPFKRASDYIQESHQLLHLTIKGLCYVSARVPLVEALANYQCVVEERELAEEEKKEIGKTKKEAAFAKNERDKGFPRLNAHAVVSLWGILESTIREFAITFLINVPETLGKGDIAKIRVTIPLAKFETLSIGDRMHLLVQELERKKEADFKRGVDRFECILDAFDLSGKIDKTTKRNIYEMQQVRNIIVHNASIVDRHFIEACPWKKVKAGDQLCLNQKDYFRYAKSLDTYLVCIIERLTEFIKTFKSTPSKQ